MYRIFTYIFLCALCLTGSRVINYYYGDTGVSGELINEVSHRLEKQMALVEEEVEQFSKREVWKSTYPIFLIDGSRILRWTDNSFVPDLTLFKNRKGWNELNHPQGIYLVYGKKLSSRFRVIGLLPVYRNFKVSNRYLQPQWNEAIFEDEKMALLLSSSKSGKPVKVKGHTFFRIEPFQTIYKEVPAMIVLLSGFSAVVFFGLALMHVCKRLHRAKKYFYVMAILLLGSLAVRAVMMLISFPRQWWHGPVFSPMVYASSVVNYTIGDLFLNALIFLFPILYISQISSRLRWKTISHYSLPGRICFTALLFFIGYAGIGISYIIVQTISHNSKIKLDVNFSITMDSKTTAAFAAMLAWTIVGFLTCHLVVRWIARSGLRSIEILVSIFIAVIFIFFIFIITGKTYYITLTVGTAYFILLVLTGLYRSTRVGGTYSIFYLLLVFAAYSAQYAMALKHFFTEDQQKLQKHLAESLFEKNDEVAEYLLNETLKAIRSDTDIQDRMSKPVFSRKSVRQKIKQVYLSHYFDRYDINIYFFNAAGEPQDEESRRQFQETSMNQRLGATLTPFPNIYLMEKDPNSFKQYQASTPIYHNTVLQGHVMLDLRIKKVIPKRVYPELLTDTRFAQFSSDGTLSYALYSGNKWITTFGEYLYEHEFDKRIFLDSTLYNSGVSEDKFFHVAVSDGKNTLIVSDELYHWNYAVATFSSVYLGWLCLLFIWLLWRGAAHLVKELQLPYSDRIQTFSFVLLTLPLLVLVLSVIRQMGDSAENLIRETYEYKSSALGEAVVSVFENPEYKNNQMGALNLLARSSDTDFSVYDTRGYLKVTSQPMIYESQLVSDLINPKAFVEIKKRGINHVFEEERIGSLSYSNSYRQLKSSVTGKMIGILSIPFFESQSSFEKTRNSVFISIMITFTIVLIIFLLLSIWAARWLTYPLRWITEILRRTSLRENKKMDWLGKDEIGVMVNEYNKLVDKLELSKLELARSQKEKAWREIAQQVAHEIKNPLTPMKLTLQQMENQISSNEFQSGRGLKAIANLLEQVTILDEIASSFSSFAKMPAPVSEQVEITDIIAKVANLYVNDPRGNVHLICPYSQICAVGDTLLLTRIFSNIVLNALQSSEDNDPEVVIEVRLMVGEVVVSVTDNGDGIPEDARQRIFLPHFTTKKSGSGLGLAICRQGVEQMNGRIWCTSEVNKGTTFYVALPLSR